MNFLCVSRQILVLKCFFLFARTLDPLKQSIMVLAPHHESAPTTFFCPISLEVMEDPVSTVDGHTYERASIVNWYIEREDEEDWMDPPTWDWMGKRAQPLTDPTLTDNLALRYAIEGWEIKNDPAMTGETILRSELTPVTSNSPHTASLSFNSTTLIGKGSFKEVHRAIYDMPGSDASREVAVMKVQSGDVAKEAKVLLKIGRHPHLVRFLGLSNDGAEEQLMVMEFAALGDVGSLIVTLDADEEGTVIPFPHKLCMMQQVSSAMAALVAERLFHRDLAIRNILVFGFNIGDVSKTLVKVSDFGLAVNACTATHMYVQNEGAKPIRYLSPEALVKARYSEKSDVWAFGVMAWELLKNGDKPYYQIIRDEDVIPHVLGGSRLPRPTKDECPADGLWTTIESCWDEKKKGRPSFEALTTTLSSGKDLAAAEAAAVQAAAAEAAAALAADKEREMVARQVADLQQTAAREKSAREASEAAVKDAMLKIQLMEAVAKANRERGQQQLEDAAATAAKLAEQLKEQEARSNELAAAEQLELMEEQLALMEQLAAMDQKMKEEAKINSDRAEASAAEAAALRAKATAFEAAAAATAETSRKMAAEQVEELQQAALEEKIAREASETATKDALAKIAMLNEQRMADAEANSKREARDAAAAELRVAAHTKEREEMAAKLAAAERLRQSTAAEAAATAARIVEELRQASEAEAQALRANAAAVKAAAADAAEKAREMATKQLRELQQAAAEEQGAREASEKATKDALARIAFMDEKLKMDEKANSEREIEEAATSTARVAAQVKEQEEMAAKMAEIEEARQASAAEAEVLRVKAAEIEYAAAETAQKERQIAAKQVNELQQAAAQEKDAREASEETVREAMAKIALMDEKMKAVAQANDERETLEAAASVAREAAQLKLQEETAAKMAAVEELMRSSAVEAEALRDKAAAASKIENAAADARQKARERTAKKVLELQQAAAKEKNAREASEAAVQDAMAMVALLEEQMEADAQAANERETTRLAVQWMKDEDLKGTVLALRQSTEAEAKEMKAAKEAAAAAKANAEQHAKDALELVSNAQAEINRAEVARVAHMAGKNQVTIDRAAAERKAKDWFETERRRAFKRRQVFEKLQHMFPDMSYEEMENEVAMESELTMNMDHFDMSPHEEQTSSARALNPITNSQASTPRCKGKKAHAYGPYGGIVVIKNDGSEGQILPLQEDVIFGG